MPYDRICAYSSSFSLAGTQYGLSLISSYMWSFCVQDRRIHTCIRELVDSLCRDGTDTSIVCVHMKAF